MRRSIALSALLLATLGTLGSLGCTSSKWCADCGTHAPILGLNYLTNLVYTVGNPISENVPNPAGGTPVHYTVVSGTLPPGLTLDPATGFISGTPTTPGVYSLVVLGTNPANTARQTLQITVVPAQPLALGYSTPMAFPANAGIPVQLATLSYATPGLDTTYAVTTGALPAGLLIDAASGTIAGSPTTPGTVDFTVTATNGTRTATRALTYTITPAGSLTLTYPTPQTFPAGTAIATQTPTASALTPGIPGTYALTTGTLPPGLTFNADGTITGTPTTPGVFSFGVTLTNGTRSAYFVPTYTVTPAGALTLGYTTPVQFTQGTAIASQAATVGNATPGVATTFALTGGSLPGGLSLNTATGAITGTPTTPGVFAFTIAATNGARNATATPTYTVVSSSPMTLSYASPQFFPVGSAIASQNPTAGNLTPGVSTTYAVTAGSLPAGLTLNAATGAITGTPSVTGVSAFTVTATNGTRTATSSPTYVVEETTALGLAYTTPRTFTQNAAIASQTGTVTNGTPGVTTTFAVTSGSLPAGLTLHADGTITGTPTTAGVFTFTVTATNGTRTATSTPTYTVETAATLTVSYPTPRTFTQGSAIATQSPTVTNGTPGVTTTYAVTSGSLPAGLTLNADGTLTGTPTTAGVFTFTVTATNGTRTATSTPTYTVESSATLTIAYTTPQTFPPSVAISTQTPTMGNETPGVTSTFAVTAGSLPTGLTLNADGTITGTPTVAGTYAFTVTATNGTRTATSSPTWTVQVAAPTGLAYTTPTTYTSGFAIPANNPNPTGGTPTGYAVTSGSLPAGLTLDGVTGVISGTPTASGSFTVTITGSNGAGSAQQVLSITVLAPITANLTANPATVSVGQSSSLTPIFSGGTGTIDQSIGTVGSGGGIPTGVFGSVGTTTYTLTVSNANGDSRTSTATVTVVAAPPYSVTFPVPTTGTTYTYPNAGDPLSGLQVVVPNQGNAVCASTDLTVIRGVGDPQPGAIGGGAIAVSDPWTFSSTVGYPFRKPMTVTLPYDGSGLSGTDVPVPFYWDPAYGKWVAVGLKSFNSGAQTLTFTTLLPGTYTVMAIPGLSASLADQSLGFTPTTDSWFQPNQGVFDDPGGSSFGMSAFASWYFGMAKSANGNAGLYTLFREGNVNSTADDVSARALISRLANGTLETWHDLWPQGAYGITDVQTGLALITGLRVSGLPQVFLMGEARPAVDNATATLVTGYTAASGKFNILDPNYPGMPLTITWNSGTGAFTSYDRAAGYVPTFTKYAFEGQTSIHRLSDYERVLVGATGGWSTPPFATLTVSDVGGAGAVNGGDLVSVASASNVTITGTLANGSDTATHIYWSQNGGARTAVALSGSTFTFTIPALVDPYGTRIALETTANPCDPTFSYTGYLEFNVKEVGRTAWFPNICFETGSNAPWTLEQGNNAGVAYPGSPSFSSVTGQLNSYAITWSVGSVDSALVTVGNDTNVASISRVFDGSSAFRVNNPATGAHISRMYQDIVVPADVAVPKVTFYWAAVMQNAGHAATDQPFVDILVQDVTNSYETVYFKHFYANDPSYPGWIAGNGAGASQWFGINWQKVGLSNLAARAGHTLRITVMAGDCNQGGHGGYAYLDGVNCN